ncbi:MAG: class I SAM-dependent methyltransferase [Myxococcota bacterium]
MSQPTSPPAFTKPAVLIDRVREVIRDRQNRRRMAESNYWNERVQSRTGHARSVWHAEHFSDAWHARQVRLLRDAIDELLGGAHNIDALDVGCGTGRITLELQLMGARTVGVDFSDATVKVASEEAQAMGADVRYVVGDIAQPPLPLEDASFDAVVAVGCLAVACRGIDELEASMREMRRLVRPRGAVILLEPIHTTRLLGRVLKAPAHEWITAAEHAGLRLMKHDGMGFVPTRLALSSFDLPPWFVRPVFAMGERTLERVPSRRLADYTLLGFHRADRES